MVGSVVVFPFFIEHSSVNVFLLLFCLSTKPFYFRFIPTNLRIKRDGNKGIKKKEEPYQKPAMFTQQKEMIFTLWIIFRIFVNIF